MDKRVFKRKIYDEILEWKENRTFGKDNFPLVWTTQYGLRTLSFLQGFHKNHA